jgi:hypothetical protein
VYYFSRAGGAKPHRGASQLGNEELAAHLVGLSRGYEQGLAPLEKRNDVGTDDAECLRAGCKDFFDQGGIGGQQHASVVQRKNARIAVTREPSPVPGQRIAQIAKRL